VSHCGSQVYLKKLWKNVQSVVLKTFMKKNTLSSKSYFPKKNITVMIANINGKKAKQNLM
jgi:hypothetical protein